MAAKGKVSTDWAFNSLILDRSQLDQLVNIKNKDPQKTVVSKETLAGAGVIPVSSQLGFGDVTTQVQMALQSFWNSDESAKMKLVREIASNEEGATAVDELVNSMFVINANKRSVSISLERLEAGESTNKKLISIFEDMYDRLKFENRIPQFLRRWIVDGKLFVHKVKNSNGINTHIVMLSNDKTKKFKIVDISMDRGIYNMAYVDLDKTDRQDELYVFEPTYEMQTVWSRIYNNQLLLLHPDSIAYVDSGLYGCDGEPESKLARVIPSYKKLKELEISALVFRITRSPMRKVFYIYVGDVNPKLRDSHFATQIESLQAANIVDAKGGTSVDNIATAIGRDLYIPRTTEGTSTEVDTIGGQMQSDIIQELEMATERYVRNLPVPKNRIIKEGTGTSIFTSSAEIDREEYTFARDISLLRSAFSPFIKNLFKDELVQNGYSLQEATQYVDKVVLKWHDDSSFDNIRRLELFARRLEVLDRAVDSRFVGVYYSAADVFANVLGDDNWEETVKAVTAIKYGVPKPDEE